MKKENKNTFLGLLKNKKILLFILLLVFWWSFLAQVDFGKSDVFHDSDGDGLSDAQEYAFGTDSFNSDTDGDGYSDRIEVEAGYDPLKPSPGDKIVFEIKKNNQEKETQEKETQVNLTEEFFKELTNQKSEEINVLSDYSDNPDKYNQNEEAFSDLNDLSLTNQEIQDLIQQTTTDFSLNQEMELISKDQIKVLDKTDNEKEEKEQIEKYLTQIFYVLSVNKPFSVEEADLLAQVGVEYINQINNSIQSGKLDVLKDLKERSLKTYEECLKIKTPYKTKEIHQKTLSLIKYLTEDIKEEKLIDQKDPLTIALYVGKLQAAVIEGESLKNEIEEIIREYKIEIFNEEQLRGIF